MKLIFLVRNVFILHLLFSSLAYAGQFDNPYQGNIVVAGQSENALKKLALQQVLVKVSGNVEIAKLEQSQALFTKINRLLSQYGYHDYRGTRYFMAVFDKNEINQTLLSMQQPIWGITRPTTLVWMVSDSNELRQFISDDLLSQSRNADIAAPLLAQQHNRGINLQFPLIDLDDTLALTMSDVSGRFYEQVAKASQRYAVEHFVNAHLTEQSPNKWTLTWALLRTGRTGKPSNLLLKNTLSGERGSILASMTSAIADYYASQYAILENAGENLSQTIYISGINSLAQFTQLSTVLQRLAAVAAFEVVSVQGPEVIIDIQVNGGLDSFKNGLFAQPNLRPDSSHSEPFYFNWR